MERKTITMYCQEKIKFCGKKIKSVNIGSLFKIKTYHLSEDEWSQN